MPEGQSSKELFIFSSFLERTVATYCSFFNIRNLTNRRPRRTMDGYEFGLWICL